MPHIVVKRKLRLAAYLFLVYKGGMKLLSTNEAAVRLGISVRRVQALIEAGKLSAHKLGRDYAIEEIALETVKVYGKAGRPPKAKADKASGTDGKVKVKASKSTPPQAVEL